MWKRRNEIDIQKNTSRDLNPNWKFLTMAKMHHPKADVDRLYIPRKAGGKGLVHL